MSISLYFSDNPTMGGDLSPLPKVGIAYHITQQGCNLNKSNYKINAFTAKKIFFGKFFGKKKFLEV